MLYWSLVVLHVLVSLFLIAVILLQTGKRADLAGAFGGGGSQTAFGPRGATNFLSRATTVCAVLFMVTSLSLAILSSEPGGTGGSVLDEVPQQQAPPQPLPQQTPQEVPPSTPGAPPAPSPNPDPSGK
jgi:preprotein translocase subunit SecG